MASSRLCFQTPFGNHTPQSSQDCSGGSSQALGVCDRNQEPGVTTHVEADPSSPLHGDTGRGTQRPSASGCILHKLRMISLILLDQNFSSSGQLFLELLPTLPSRPGHSRHPCPLGDSTGLGVQGPGLGAGPAAPSQLCDRGEATQPVVVGMVALVTTEMTSCTKQLS